MPVRYMKAIGYMLMEWDEPLQAWKPINPKNRNDWNPWFYSQTSALQVLTNLKDQFHGVKFDIAKVSL